MQIVLSFLFIFISIPTFAAPFPWNCKGLWIFESYEALPAREITAQLSTTSTPDTPHPITIDVGSVRLEGTVTRRSLNYEFQAQTSDRLIVLSGTLKTATEPLPLKLSVLIEGQSNSGNRLTGILTCTPR